MKTEKTFYTKIYMSGPIEVAKQILRAECSVRGLCVTVEPLTYIYTGGEENGYVVGLIQYPRFPVENSIIEARALEIAKTLVKSTYQASCTVMTPVTTYFIESETIKKN